MSTLPSGVPPRDSVAQIAELRPRLVMFFSVRARNLAVDDLAHEVILRVLKSVAAGELLTDVGAYAFGVARKVLLEHYRSSYDRRRTSLDDLTASGDEPAAPLDDGDDDDFEAERRCLSQCLASLRTEDRRLMAAFYADGKNKSNRAALAIRLGVSRNALDQRASKIRGALRTCAEACLSGPQSNTTPGTTYQGEQR